MKIGGRPASLRERQKIDTRRIGASIGALSGPSGREGSREISDWEFTCNLLRLHHYQKFRLRVVETDSVRISTTHNSRNLKFQPDLRSPGFCSTHPGNIRLDPRAQTYSLCRRQKVKEDKSQGDSVESRNVRTRRITEALAPALACLTHREICRGRRGWRHRNSAGQGTRGIQIRAFVHAYTKPIDEFAAEPSANQRAGRAQK